MEELTPEQVARHKKLWDEAINKIADRQRKWFKFAISVHHPDKTEVTGKEMCEAIAKTRLLINKSGNPLTADQIWTYSPTGELSMIWDWYIQSATLIASEEQFRPFMCLIEKEQ